MRLLDYLFGFVALLGLICTGWWALYQSANTPVNLQARLEANANAALDEQGFDWAGVRMHGQRAELTGKAPSIDAIEAAAQTVLTSSGSGGVIIGGVTMVESGVDTAPPVSPYIWRAIKTHSGDYILMGHVPSRTIRADLVDAAVALAGDARVEDHMQLANGAPAAYWQGMARLALESLGELDTGEARLHDQRVRLRGVSMDTATRARISADIANVTAPFRGEPFLRGPALWSATHGEGELVLSGKVATEAERAEILAIARQYYARNVRDEMEVAGGPHPGWLDGVRVGLPHFAHFQSGEMAFDPEETGLSFEGEASGSTIAYLQQDLAAVSGPYPVTVFADTVQVDVDEIRDIDFGADPVAACQKAFAAVMETNKVNFETGLADISRESGQTLDKLMTVSQRCAPALVFEVGGHTDSLGEREANIALSEARAQAVRDYMVAAGFSPSRLTVIGYGPDEAVQSNDTEDGRAKNRRIGFKVRERSE
jgi:OmpA-OmpF porin, OOP family